MAQVALVAPPIIDFSSYVAERTAGFQGREWVFADLDNWLRDETAPRCYLLTGEPGSGKSAIAAQLVNIHSGKAVAPAGVDAIRAGFLAAYHFCFSREYLWINPLTFSQSVSQQLRETVPDFAKHLIQNAGHGTTYIEGKAEVTAGTAQGVAIGTVNIPSMPSQKAFALLVTAPLQRCLTSKPEQNVVLLIDAIDDSRFYRGDDSILSLLAHCEELQRVRFIITTRHDSHVENEFTDSQVIDLSRAEYRNKNRADVNGYVRAQLPQESSQVVEDVADKADGNFQYVTFLLKTIAKGHLTPVDIQGLPPGLDELYQKSLGQVVGSSNKDWLTAYAPLLGVLAVGRQNLTSTQLQSFTSQSESTVECILLDLEEFLQETRSSGQQPDSSYRIFHQSFVEMLQSKWIGDRRTKNVYYIPPLDGHQRIVDFYRQGGEWEKVNWNEIDDYGLLHLPAHAHELRAVAAYKNVLKQLMSPALVRARWNRFQTHGPLADDARLLIAGAESAQPRDVIGIVRGTHILATLTSLASNTPPAAIRALAVAGYVPQAYGHALLIADTEKRQAALLMVHNAALKAQMYEEAREIFRGVSRELLPASVPLAAATLAENGYVDRIAALLSAETNPFRVRSQRAGVVESLCVARNYDAALKFAGSNSDVVEQVKEIAIVAGHMYPEGDGRADSTIADALARARSIADIEQRAAALSHVANVLIRSGREQQGKHAGLEAVANIDAAPPNWTMMATLCRLAPPMASCGELPRVCASALRIGDHEAGIAKEIYAKLSPDDAPEKQPSEASRTRGRPVHSERKTVEGRMQDLTSKVDTLGARFMAARFSGINVHSQEPEDGYISIPGDLLDDDIRVNAINWIAQSISAERECKNAKQSGAHLQTVLSGIAGDDAGMKEVVLGHIALILAKAGEADESKAVVDAIFAQLAKRPISRNVYRELVLAVCAALCVAGDLRRAVWSVKPLEKTEKSEKPDLDSIWKRAARELTRTHNAIQAAGLIQAFVESPDEKATAFVDLIENLNGNGENDLPMLLALGGIGESLAKELPARARLRIFASAASQIADLGDKDMAAYVASQVIQQAEELGDLAAKGRAKVRIAERLAELGDEGRSIEAAEKSAVSASTEPDATIFIVDVVRALAASGRFDRAQAMIDIISDEESDKDTALCHMALQLSRGGRLTDALATVERIELPALKADVLAGISADLARKNERGQAMEVARNAARTFMSTVGGGNTKIHRTRTVLILGERRERPSPAWKIAHAFVVAGDQDSAQRFATELAAAIDAEADIAQASSTALCLLVAGLRDRASSMAENVSRAVPTADGDTTESGDALAHLGRFFVVSGQPDEAVSLARSLWPAQPITDDTSDSIRVHSVLNVILDIAQALWQGGQGQRAKTLLDGLRANIATILDTLLRLRARGSVCIAYLDAGLRSDAAAIANDLLLEARTAGRQFFFDAVRYGVQSLAELDNTTALWDAYQSIEDVESWWDVPTSDARD